MKIPWIDDYSYYYVKWFSLISKNCSMIYHPSKWLPIPWLSVRFGCWWVSSTICCHSLTFYHIYGTVLSVIMFFKLVLNIHLNSVFTKQKAKTHSPTLFCETHYYENSKNKLALVMYIITSEVNKQGLFNLIMGKWLYKQQSSLSIRNCTIETCGRKTYCTNVTHSITV